MNDPAEHSDAASEVERIVDDFADRCARGESPDIETFIANHPAWAEQLREILPLIVAMDDCNTSSTAADLPDDRELGDYHLLRQIGRGGMGVVYEARQVSLDRRVALKILPATAGVTGRQQMRFELESRAAARLHHSNIVPVFGVGDHNGQKYYVMQLIDGCGLDEVINVLRHRRSLSESGNREQAAESERSAMVAAAASFLLSDSTHADGSRSRLTPAPPAAAADTGLSDRQRTSSGYLRNITSVGIQIADALHYAHTQGVLHRDVKPSNLMLDADGQVWIMDFGLAKDRDSHDLTRTGDVVGTLRYMAPERFRGESDARSDVYSLGLTLYELMLLQPAFQAVDRARLIQQLTSESPPRPRRVCRGFPRDLETIVLKAIEHSPNRRYATAAELRDDLQRYLEGRTIRARRAAPVDHIIKWMLREPVVATLTITVLLTMLVGLAGISWQWREAVAARGDAEQNFVAANQQRTAANEARQIAEDNEQAAHASLRRAIQAVDAMLTSVARVELNGVPRMDRVRQELLTEALTILQQLLTESPDSELLQFETAKAYSRVADIYQLLGSYLEAEQSFERALTLLEQLAATSDAPQYRYQLATTLNHRAQLANLVGDGSAEDWLKQALAIRTEVVSQEPRNLQWRLALAGDKTDLATELSRKRRYQDADPIFRDAIGLCESLLQQDAQSIETLIQLATSYTNHGNLMRRVSRHSAAHELYAQGLDIRRALVAAHPDRPDLLEDLAISYNNLGFLERLRRRRPQAIALYQKSLQLREQLTSNHPDVPSYRKRLAFACAVLARITRDADQKEALLRRAFELRLRLTEEFPRNPEHWNDLSLAYGKLSDLLTDGQRDAERDELADQLAEAHERYLNIVGERLSLITDSADGEASGDAAALEAFIERADELRLAGLADRALPIYVEALQFADQLLEDAAADPQLLRCRARLQASWAKAMQDLNRLEEAVPHCDAAIADLESAIAAAPAEALSRERLIAVLRQKRRVLLDLNRDAQSESLVVRLHELREELATLFPDNDDYQSALAEVCRERAEAHQSTGAYADALQTLDRAVLVCRGLSEKNPTRRAWRRDLAETLYERGMLKCSNLSFEDGLRDLADATEMTRGLLTEKPIYKQQHCRTANELAWELLIGRDVSLRDDALALKLAEEVIAFSPADENYQNTYGIALLRAKQYSKAIRALEQAVQLGGGDAYDYYGLAMALWNLGKQDQALEYRDLARQWIEDNAARDDGLDVLRSEATALLGL
jgi:serine/threonine protein kinase